MIKQGRDRTESTFAERPECQHRAGEDGGGEECPVYWVYNNVVEYIDAGILILDGRRERVVYQNTTSREILHDLLPESDYLALRDLLMPGHEGRCDAGAAQGPNTLHVGKRLLGYTVYLIAEDCCCIFIRDITEKARLESIAEAVNTMDNIGYVFSGIRHEIGNPINSIKMTLSVLRRNLGRFPASTVEEYVDRGLAEISRVEFLLKSLKNFSMFEHLALQDVDLKGFMEKFLFLIRGDFEKRGVRVTAKTPEEPLWARIDPRALQQVLLNLMANASAALEGKEHPEIVLTMRHREGRAWLSVRDNGCGIPEAEQPNLFRPFYTTKASGTGLGLVITWKMLTQMESGIEIHSQEGVGTIVTLSLPAASAPDA